jgi:uncharacterized protein (TIGR02246 family)
MRRLRLAAVPLALFACACQSSTIALTDAHRTSIEDALRSTYVEVAASVAALDADRFLSFFTDTEEFAFAEFGKITRSRSAFADTTRAHWAALAEVEAFAWGDLHIQVLAPTAAVVTTTFDFTASDTSGNRFVTRPTWTAVWVEEDGEWKMVNVAETFPLRETK